MSKKNKAKLSVLALALVACMAVVGISAYFTDGDSVTNEFTIGSVDIDLVEPNWKEENAENIVPGQEIVKDPKVINTGINDAYVFTIVQVPGAVVQMANADGSVAEEVKTELFEYTVNQGWTELKPEDIMGGFATYGAVYAGLHIYAYTGDNVGVDGGYPSMKKLTGYTGEVDGEGKPVYATTPAVFDAVRLINLAEEGNGHVEGRDKEVIVTALAIQSDHLMNFGEDKPIDGNPLAPAVVDPLDVWPIAFNAFESAMG